MVRRAALGRARQRADGRGVEPGRRAPGSRRTPSAASSASPNRCRALFLPPAAVPRRAARRRVAPADPQQRARLVVRVQRRRGRRGGARALPGGAPRRRGPHPRRAAARSRPRSTSPPSSTIVVNSTARTRAGVGRASRSRAPARCTWSRSTTAPPAPRRSCAPRPTGEGISTVVVGQKIRWVLEMMRGPGARRRPHRTGRARARSPTAVTSSRSTTPRPARPSVDLEATKATAARAGRGGRHHRHPPAPRAGARGRRRRRSPCPASAGARTARSRATDPAPRCAPRGTTLGQRARAASTVDPADGTLTIDGRRRHRGRRSTATSTAATAATPTTTHRPRSTPSSTDPSRSRCAVDEVGPGASASRRHRHATAGRRTRSATSASCARRSDDARLDRRASPPSSCAPASGSSGCTSSSTTRCATTGCGPTSRCPHRVDGSDAECAFAVVHRGLTAEGGPHEFGLPTFVSRRFVDCRRPATTGLALLHDGLLEYEVVDDGRELALTLLRATGYLSRSELSLRPNPAGPLDPLEGPQLQGHARARLRGAPPPRRLADARDLRGRRRRAPRAARARARWRLARAPTSRRPVSALRRRRRRGVGAAARRRRAPRSCGW